MKSHEVEGTCKDYYQSGQSICNTKGKSVFTNGGKHFLPNLLSVYLTAPLSLQAFGWIMKMASSYVTENHQDVQFPPEG